MTLERLIADARERVEGLRPARAALERAAADAPPPPPWAVGFDGDTVAVIAEIKRRSPSAGDLVPDLDPVALAGAYERGGARVVSVLTDPRHFGGTMDDLRSVAAVVDVPVLRKDFIVDRLQLLEARAAGASAVLLIVRALPPADLAALHAEAGALGLGTLVEVHRAEELEPALAAGARVIGVNARDLDSFAVRLENVAPVIGAIPPEVVAIAESGIGSRADVERLAAWGADGILVGTGVVRAASPEAAVRALAAVRRRGRPKGAA